MTLRLERAARLFLLRFTSHDAYAAVRCLREISALASLLVHSHNSQVLRQADANIYTHIQSALRGKSKIRRRSLVAGIENIFFGCKTVLNSVRNLRGAPKEHRRTITSLMEKMSALFICLELQLMAGTAEKSAALGKELLKESSAMRRLITASRLEALCAHDQGLQSSSVNNFTTVLADIEKWLYAVEAMSALALRRRTPL